MQRLALVWLTMLEGWKLLALNIPPLQMRLVETLGYLLGAIIAGVLYHFLTQSIPNMSKIMTFVSMAGIIYFTFTTTAKGHDELTHVGWLLLLGVIAHNTIGYVLGYGLSRAFGLDVNSARSIALEVGLHNGGMAVSIATKLDMLGTLGLAAAIFSPWMNISGSLLANYWRRRPPNPNGKVSGLPRA